jgi:hypothetical protein
MFFCLPKADDVRLIASLCVCQVYNDAVQPAEQVDPLLSVGLTSIFPGDDWSVEDSFTTNEVKSMARLRRRFGSSQVGML